MIVSPGNRAVQRATRQEKRTLMMFVGCLWAEQSGWNMGALYAFLLLGLISVHLRKNCVESNIGMRAAGFYVPKALCRLC